MSSSLPLLDLRLPPSRRWKPVLRHQRDQWMLAQEAFLPDLTLPRRLAAGARALLFPPAMKAEVSSVPEALPGIRADVVQAAQVLYDESWNACRADPGAMPACGCTSVSTAGGGFGRNLDWCYPDCAEDLVTEFRVVDTYGREFLAEGFAGLLGWLALSGEELSVSLNQAPACRPISRTAVPALRWFCDLLGLADGETLDWLSSFPAGEVRELEAPWTPGADVLMHLVAGDRRYLLESFGRRVRIRAARPREKLAQANVYQLFDMKMSEDWEADSAWRMSRVLSGRGVRNSLDRAYVDGRTVHQFVMG
ncbi:MAG TPA: hypothetical protein PLA50_00100 [Bacteroidia bacterium]|nr:hypothetical protein [Bacteroidia bacterium]